MVILSKIVLSW